MSGGEDMEQGTAVSVKRSEMMAGAALLFSAASMIWTGGVVYGQVQEHDRRIAQVETTLNGRDGIAARVERIDANVAMMTERMAEDRHEREERQ